MMDKPATEASPRQKRREATSERILEIAASILERDGLEALTMQRLASELGYTVGATYRYYASKDAIVAALQRRVFEALETDLRAALDALESRGARPGMLASLTRVALVARVYATIATRRPLDARLLTMMLGDPSPVLQPELGAANVEVALRIGSEAVRELAAARESGALGAGDDVERALVLWASLQGVAQTRKLERFGIPGLSTDRIAEQLVRTLLAGWGAEPARAREALARAAEIV